MEISISFWLKKMTFIMATVHTLNGRLCTVSYMYHTRAYLVAYVTLFDALHKCVK